MSFLSKYTELGLPTDSLLAWHTFDSESDSSLSGNNLVFLTSDSGFFQSGAGVFDDHFLKIDGIEASSFVAILDFENQQSSNPKIIISNSDAGYGFFLGCSQNGDFFLFVNAYEGSSLRFYESIKTSNRAILIFSKINNSFSLSSYCPISDKIENESISVDPVTFGGLSLKIGYEESFSQSFFKNSQFKLHELAVLEAGAPDFVLMDLCREIYSSSGSEKSDFLFKSVAVREKESQSRLEIIYNNKEYNTSLVLPYSELERGFSLYPNTLNDSPRFFRNGIREDPLISDGYAKFEIQNKSDIVVLDNFSNEVDITAAKIPFVGVATGEFPRNAASVYGSSNNRQHLDFCVLQPGNECYFKNIVFPSNPNLFKL